MSQSLVEVVDKCAGDQQIINGDELLGHRRCAVAVTQNGVTRSMELSLGATSVQELHRLAVLQRTTGNQVTSDCIVLETFEHFATKQAKK